MSHRLASGAQRSERARGYHLIPLTALRREAERMDQGAASHGDYNWRKGVHDPQWISECFNHIMEHLIKWRHGEDEGDDHLAAVRCGVAFLMVSEEEAPRAILEALRSYQDDVPVPDP